METNAWRVVFDTNVFISAALIKSMTSPTRELVDRWQGGEFILLTCEALVSELIEVLRARRIYPGEISAIVAGLKLLAEWVPVPVEMVQPVLSDPDDNVVLACAVLGQAHYLVTYDPHFDVLGGEYLGVKILKALPFLWRVRGDRPPADQGSTS